MTSESSTRIAVCVAILLSICTGPVLAQQASVRAELTTEPPFWVGQRVGFSIELLSPTFFSGAPRFDLPEIPNVLLMKIEDRPTVSTEMVDETQFSVQRHEFAIFAQRAGTHLIPPIQVRFGIVGKPGEAAQQISLSTNAMKIDARLPPGAESVSMLLSTSDLQADQTWNPSPGDAKVGDAFTRTITFKATDVPGMAFPPLPSAATDGLGVYVQQPVVDDSMQRGTFVGNRIESIVYVCERPGLQTIPTIVVPWFDLEAKTMRRIELKGLDFQVTATATPAQDPSSSTPEITHREEQVLTFVIVLLAMVIATVVALRHRISKIWHRRTAAAADSESALFSKLLSDCRSNNPTAALKSLFRWLDRVDLSDGSATIHDFTTQVGQHALDVQLSRLQEAALGNGPWHGQPCATELQAARKVLNSRSVEKKREFLPPLNP